MRPLHLAVDRLPDVVEESGPLGDLGLGAELGGHVRREPRDLLGMLKNVLAVRGPVLQPPQQLDQLRVQVGDRELERGRFPFLADLLPQLRAHLLDDLLDARRVDAAVRDQLLQGQARHLAAQRLERRDDDGLGRVVDDQVHPGGGLQSSDVAPFAPDDPPLQVIGRELHDRDRGLDDRVRGEALDCHADQTPRLLRGLLDGLFLDAPDEPGRLHPRLVLDRLDQVPLGVHGRQAGDLLESLFLLLDDMLDLPLRLLHPLLSVGEGLFLSAVLLLAALLLGELAVEVLLLLDHSLLQGGDLLPADGDGLVELGPGGQDLLLGFDRGLAQPGLGGPGGLGEHPIGLRANVLALGLQLLPEEYVGDGGYRGGQKEARRDRNREVCVHLGSPISRGTPKRTRRLHDDPEVSLPPRACTLHFPDL